MSPVRDVAGEPTPGWVWRDTVASVLVAVVVLLLVPDLTRPGLPFVPGPRGIAVIALVAGITAFVVDARVATVGRLRAGLLGAVGIIAVAFALSTIDSGSPGHSRCALPRSH
ncbi:hypothetical protein ACVGVM_12025 [Pseudonocardia bannensis]|uniref:Uncharacterized protein n=1 Tax=Pseudonocardia bannensis TaxID=630973 RepID=A0A848DF11_9PSEU|nr:hypothetical protein [Pseudonocardia bannensis]NMH91197.1 hypothetical protein [Pseudonocardia bannensis]